MTIGIDASRYNLPHPTGVEKYTNQIIEAILRTNWKPHHIRLYVRTPEQKQKLETATDSSRFAVTHIPFPYFWTLLGLSWELKRHPVDLLFVPSHTLPLITPQETIATVHGIEAITHPKTYTWFKRTYQKWALKRMIVKKTRLIAVSESIKNDLVKYLNADPKLISVIHNGFTPPARMADLETVKKRYHLPERYILNIGRIEPRKNQLSLIKAFEDIAIEEKDLHLIIAGKPTKEGEDTIALGKNSRFSNRISILNYVPQEDLNTITKQASIFAYPSIAEGFGIPILEAMSLGIPVVTSKGSSCEEIAKDAAILVDPLNIESIKAGLKKLLTDQAVQNKLSYAGQERSKNFSWGKCCEETSNILKETVSQRL